VIRFSNRFNPCERLLHGRSEGRSVTDVVVSCGDHALKHQVPDCRAQGLAAPPRYDGVVLRRQQSRGREQIANELDRRHEMTEEQANRSPPVQISSEGL
jgi:hypothetical protein